MPGGDDRRALLQSLRDETARVRDLVDHCRESQVVIESLPERLRTAREFVAQGQLDSAFGLLRELELEMLAQVLLHEPPPSVPPGLVENPPVPAAPSEEVLSAINRAPAWKVRIPKPERASGERLRSQ